MASSSGQEHHYPAIAKLLGEDARRSLPIVCRFVPLDQWLVTHIDTSWKIKDVKNWILIKCNAWGTSGNHPQAPRFRPASPVTFAPSRRSSADSLSFGETEDGEDDDFDEFAYDYYRDLRTSDSLAPNMGVEKSPVIRTLEELSSPSSNQDSSLSSNFVLYSFSCGHILEDEGHLSWYNLRPFELVEVHRLGAIVPLPRESKTYVDPYFESPAKVSEKPLARLSRKPRPSWSADEPVIEWKTRWLIIRDGTLYLCKEPTGTPTHNFPLSCLMAIRGPEQLGGPIRPQQRVICAKFRQPSAGNQEAKESSGPSAWNADRKSYRRVSGKNTVWLALEVMSWTVYDSLLRVLHRQAPQATSSFLKSAHSARNSFSSTHSANTSFASFGIQYPEWRRQVLDRSRRAGLGDIGPAMACHLFSTTDSDEQDVSSKPRATSILGSPTGSLKFGRKKYTSWTNSEAAEEESDDEDVESEVEWDGWMRDLIRRSVARPTIPSTQVPPLPTKQKEPVAPSSPSSSEYSVEAGNIQRNRTLSLVPEARATTSSVVVSAPSSRRSRSSTISASDYVSKSVGKKRSDGAVIESTSTRNRNQPPSILRYTQSPTPPASPSSISSTDQTTLGASLAPPSASPAMTTMRRFVRVGIKNAFSTERIAKSLEDALDFVDGK